MTQEELLERIAKLSITPETNVVPSELATALMAVVELHQPKTPTLPTIIEWDTKTFTNHFIYEDKCAIDGKSYPCLTIQTIEKELG